MEKTTLYLPDDLRRAIAELSEFRGCSQAELIREALAGFIKFARPPSPTLPLFTSGDPTLAEDVDRALRGFGER